jgi:hypothetical protein
MDGVSHSVKELKEMRVSVSARNVNFNMNSVMFLFSVLQIVVNIAFRNNIVVYFRPCRSSGTIRRLLTSAPDFEPRSGHAGFVVDKAALVHVFFYYLGFSCQFSFQRLLHIHHPSSGAGTICQTYQMNSVSPHPERKFFFS